MHANHNQDQISGLRNIINSKPVKVIAVTGGKGGVGKTNVSINLAQALTSLGQQVMLLDADFGLANIDVLLGLRAEKNISHVLNGELSLKDIMLHTPSGIKVIPASSGIQKMAELSSQEHYCLIRAFSDLKCNIDTLIVDTAAGISKDVLNFSQAANDVLVVVCNEPTSITDSYALIKVLSKECGVKRFHIVANMVKNYDEGRSLFLKLHKAADKFLDVSLLFDGVIPFDNLLRKSIQQQKIVVEHFPSSPAAIAFKQICNKITRWPVPQTMGHISFFIERIINNEAIMQEVYS